MAELSDEEKAKLVGGDVEAEKPDEPTDKKEASTEEEPVETNAEEEEKPEEQIPEESEPEATTFTKQFPNLKGETEAEYIQALEEAYKNSTTEAIRLKQAAEATVAAPAAPAQPAAPVQPQPPAETNPDLLYAKALREREMNTAFDKFAESYPNVRESADFDRFAAASDGVWAAWTSSHNGQAPTFDQLYGKIADVLDWKPINPKKDAALKNSGASSQTSSSTLAPSRQPNASDKEVAVLQRLIPGTSVADARKEIAAIKA